MHICIRFIVATWRDDFTGASKLYGSSNTACVCVWGGGGGRGGEGGQLCAEIKYLRVPGIVATGQNQPPTLSSRILHSYGRSIYVLVNFGIELQNTIQFITLHA